jgi:hypothetical protein
MANISTVEGTIEIIAPSMTDVITIANVLMSQHDGDYSTFYNFFHDDKQKPIMIDESRWYMTASFSAFGRWTYQNNLNSDMALLKKDISISEDIKYLESIPWKLIYDYQEYECGMSFFDHAVHVLDHKCGDSLENVTSEEMCRENNDYSAISLVEEGFVNNIDIAVEELNSIEDEESLAQEFARCKEYLIRYKLYDEETAKLCLLDNCSYFNEKIVSLANEY